MSVLPILSGARDTGCLPPTREAPVEPGQELDAAPGEAAARLPDVSARRILGLFCLSRLWTFAWVTLGHTRREFLSPVTGGFAGVEQWHLNAWTTYDSEWYLRIATHGYEPHTTVFFPLYPLLLRLAGGGETAMVAWGVLLSNACFAGALLLAYRLARLDHSERTAWRATWILAFFPTAPFFSAVYTESLFLLLLLGCFYLARRRSWLAAGGLACLASLTRNPGVVIFAALALEYALWIRRSGAAIRARHLAGLCLPLLGFAVVQGYFALEFGGVLSGVSSQSHYHRAPSLPWTPVLGDLLDLLRLEGSAVLILVNLLAVTLPFVWSIRYRREQPPSYALLMLSVVMMHLCYARTIPPYTIGAARYMSTAFPFAFLMARSCQGLRAARPVRYAALALLLPNAAFCMGFGSKAFLG